jgi:hypothetical protein
VAGNARFINSAYAPPSAALDMNIGASSPPEVPEASAMTSATALASMTSNSNSSARRAFRMSPMVS